MSGSITFKEAKYATLYLWQYIAERPNIRCKAKLPKIMWDWINEFKCRCPLCEYIGHKNKAISILNKCAGCPLDTPNKLVCTYYVRWTGADTDSERRHAALKIVELVETWQEGEE